MKNKSILRNSVIKTADPEQFWIRINRLIKAKKTTQAEVAYDIGVNYPAFRGWSHRKFYPEFNYIYAIAQVLDVPLNFLLFGEETKPIEETIIKNTQKIGEALLQLIKLVKDEI